MPRKRNKLLKGFVPCHSIELIKGGARYFELLISLIHQARRLIHMQVYILQHDATGQSVTDALKAAARRGVAVYLMVDGYASQSLPRHFISGLQEAGIRFRYFEPLLKSHHFYFGRRMHHKIVTVDSAHALTGGMNIADRYNDIDGIPAWLDFGVYVTGNIARELCLLCRREWKGYTNNPIKENCEPAAPLPPPDATLLAKICRNDWVSNKNQISRMYVEMLRRSTSHVIILSSYFLPGRVIRRQLVGAVKRGIDVKVITGGLSDVKIAKSAERWLYDYLLRNNIKVYEYQDNILHGKIASCDGEWMTVGSYNINNLSAYASMELNLVIKNPPFALYTENVLDDIIENNCIAITSETQSRSRNIFKQFIRWCSFQSIKATLYLFTFYFKRERG